MRTFPRLSFADMFNFQYTLQGFKLFLTLFLCLMPQPSNAEFEPVSLSQQSPVVVELFTSQACAHCPKADALMGDIANMNNVIALSCHVDYFSSPGDRFARSFCTQRQTAYIQQFGKSKHYTPQMVVNGRMDVVGYATDQVNAALVKGRSQGIRPIVISPQGNGLFAAEFFGQNLQGATAKIWLATFNAPQTQTVSSGANKGKRITFVNTIDDFIPQGVWSGQDSTLMVSPALGQGQAGFALLAQDTRSGQIIAAGQFVK